MTRTEDPALLLRNTFVLWWVVRHRKPECLVDGRFHSLNFLLVYAKLSTTNTILIHCLLGPHVIIPNIDDYSTQSVFISVRVGLE